MRISVEIREERGILQNYAVFVEISAENVGFCQNMPKFASPRAGWGLDCSPMPTIVVGSFLRLRTVAFSYFGAPFCRNNGVRDESEVSATDFEIQRTECVFYSEDMMSRFWEFTWLHLPLFVLLDSCGAGPTLALAGPSGGSILDDTAREHVSRRENGSKKPRKKVLLACFLVSLQTSRD